MPLLRILTLPPPSPRKTRAPAPASLAGNPGLSNGGGGGSGCWRNVTLGRWPRLAALVHGAQRPGWTRGVAGLGTARKARTPGRGFCCWKGTQARRHPAMRAAGLAESPTGTVRKLPGGRRDPAQPPWAQGIHSNVGSCSQARGRGKSQQRGLCVSKSLFQGLKWFPLNAATLQINTLGFPASLSRSKKCPQISHPARTARHLPNTQSLRVPPKDIDGTLLIPLQPPRGSHRGWGATTAGGRWWDTAGSQPPRRQRKPAWSKATKQGMDGAWTAPWGQVA